MTEDVPGWATRSLKGQPNLRPLTYPWPPAGPHQGYASEEHAQSAVWDTVPLHKT